MGNVISALYYGLIHWFSKLAHHTTWEHYKNQPNHVDCSWFFPWSRCSIFWKLTKLYPFVCVLFSLHIVPYNTYVYTPMHTYTHAQHKHTRTHMYIHTYTKQVDQEPGFGRSPLDRSLQSGLVAPRFKHSSNETQAPVWSLAELTVVLNHTYPLLSSWTSQMFMK